MYLKGWALHTLQGWMGASVKCGRGIPVEKPSLHFGVVLRPLQEWQLRGRGGTAPCWEHEHVASRRTGTSLQSC